MKAIKPLLYYLLLIAPTIIWAEVIIVENTNDDGALSLRQSINLANDGDSILFNFPNGQNANILLTTGEIIIDKKITIIGTDNSNNNAADIPTIDGNENSRIFFILSSGELILENINIVNGNKTDSSENGGAIWNAGSLTLKNCAFYNNKAQNGGAIYNTNSLDIEYCVFDGNLASNYGGAIYYYGFANLEYVPVVLQSVFTNNTAQTDGGALYSDGYGGNSSMVFLSCVFALNTAGDDGGVIFNNGAYGISNSIFVNSTIYGNQAADKGAVCHVYGDLGAASANFYNSIVWGNDTDNLENFETSNAEIVMAYCLVEETTCPNQCFCIDDLGMIYDTNPEFLSLPTAINIGIANGLILSSTSPAINSGNNAFVSDYGINFDLLGGNRIFDGMVDIGAVENTSVTQSEYTFQVDVKLYLEGAYNTYTGTMNCNLSESDMLPQITPFMDNVFAAEMDSIQFNATNQIYEDKIVDWLYIEFRTSPEGESIKGKSVLLLENGSLVNTTGESSFNVNLPPFDSLYIVIRHQNHIDVMSHKIEWANSIISHSIVYDFTENIEKAMGFQQQKWLETNVAVMFAGDINWDNSIQVSDYDLWKQTPAVSVTYSPIDLNLDGQIQTTDYDAWYQNRTKLGNPILIID